MDKSLTQSGLGVLPPPEFLGRAASALLPPPEILSPDLASALEPEKSDRSILLAAKGGSIVFVGALFGYGSQLVIGILLTRLMGAEQYGQYKVAIIAGEMAAGLALLGLDWAMVRFV